MMVKAFKVTCTNSNTAYNVANSTTAAPASNSTDYRGQMLLVQCQTANAVTKVGGSDVVSLGGIIVPTVTAAGTSNASAPFIASQQGVVHVNELWVTSDTAGAVVIALLFKRA